MKTIEIIDFMPKIFNLWDKQWLLLTSGDFEKQHFNTMTVSWGYFGIMWDKPVAVVVVRPTRFTYEFMEKYNTFTLSSFEKSFKKDLNILGSKSGRDGDKIAETRLTVVPSTLVAAPTFKEAELIVECRKIYSDDFKPENFLDKSFLKNYPKKDYHRMYFGEVLHISGEKNYSAE
jgi:flavin reductase (DIM6/NTAB) family NADH-FMN oxidoreductase RutF